MKSISDLTEQEALDRLAEVNKSLFDNRNAPKDSPILQELNLENKLLNDHIQSFHEEEDVDDWAGEREFMRAEGQNRRLTEDERIIYGL